MKFAVFLFVILLDESISIASVPNEQLGCFKIDKNYKKFQFFCSNADKLFNESCADSALSRAIHNLNSSDVTELKVSGCGVNGINFALDELENVNNLDILYTNYGSNTPVDWSELKIGNKVTRINMSHNGLTRIPTAIIDKETNLKVIDLSSNNLTISAMNALKNASELVEMHLQHNRIEEFRSEFAHWSKLEFLDLSDNHISSISSIELPKSLKRLHLENNPIKEFPCFSYHSEQWIHLGVVYISWPSVEKLKLKCIHNRKQLVEDENEFIAFKNEIAELHYNRQSFGNIKEFSVQWNQKEPFGKFMSTVTPTLLRSLETLDLSHSKELKEFDFNDWRTMKNLKEINIANCNLTRVENPSALQSMNLRKFVADYNQIENAHEIIPYLSRLIERLGLSECSLGEVNADTFKNLVNLKELTLRSAKMNIIDSSPFDQLHRLEWLDISRSDLSNASGPILSRVFEKLWWFDATNCRISNAREIIKSLGPSIRFAYLSGNFIGKLNAESFQGMKKLTVLSLVNTNLSIGDSNPFEALERVNDLDVSRNDLSNVNFSILSPTLQKLEYFHAAGIKNTNAVDLVNALGSGLRGLFLSDNFIGNLNFTIFNKFRLYDLDLRNTSLQIQDTEPIHHSTLHDLDVSQNNFSDFNFTVLSLVLQSLWTFRAVDCQIKQTDDIFKYFGKEIWEINLSENPIEGIDSKEFQRFARLNRLHLSNINLVDFDFSSLEQSNKLEVLNISFNHLKEVDISSTHPNLKTIDLRGNQLNKIENLNRQHLPALRSVGISGNRLNCEYLEQLKNEWPDLKFINDDWSQEDKKCSKPYEITLIKP